MSNNERMTRNEQREAARAKAREIRESQNRNAKRKRLTIQLSIVTVLVLIFGGIGVTVAIEANKPIEVLSTPKNFDFDGGIRLGKDMKVINKADATNDVPNIILFLDYQCPACRMFELPNNAQLRQLVGSGKYTLELHPVAFLDGNSQNQYSSRTGSAAACVATFDPDHFFDFTSTMYEHQSEEGTFGWSNDELANKASAIGVTNPSAINCIKTAKFQNYILSNTEKYFGQPMVKYPDLIVNSTPFIVVNGVKYEGDITNPAAFAQWLNTVAPSA